MCHWPLRNLLFHTTESHNVPKSIWCCNFVYRSNIYYSLLSIKKIKKIFNIYTGIHKIFMHKSEESCPGLEKSRVSIFIIDLRPPRVSYLALTRSGSKCGSSFSWQLSKIDFQNLVVKRSMKQLRKIIGQRIFIRVYWFRVMGISPMRRWWTYTCVNMYVLAE